ncbi:ABC transporter ATP-binding protein [Streptomyces abikoensis]|uniref:ABC transporter ATP-binding protein n=1 Tax=Streptomyces abikoensis TaxID=97398 RepID=A0ABW7TGW6_9ACTN
MTPYTLRVRDVHKAYGRRRVLRGVSLDVPRGAVVGLLGENGSGKTTLVRIVCGDLRPDSGTVERSGRIGYCPQEPVLNDELTVGQHLRFFQVAYGLERLARADELLDHLECREYRHERVGTLSGGTRQKLNLTIALMHDPPVLVLDEPYQGFDWETYLRFWELTKGLRDRGRSVLMISHLTYDSARFDALGRLRDGVIRFGRGGTEEGT